MAEERSDNKNESEQDRRQSYRLNKSIFLQHLNKDKNIWLQDALRNFSEGGICFTSDSIFIEGKDLDLRIRLPSCPTETLEIKAKVIESKKYLTRVQFLKLTEDCKRKIKEYIASSVEKKNIIF